MVVGLALAVAGGTLLERLHMEKHVEQFVFSAGSIDIESPELTRRERVRYAREQAVSTFKKVASLHPGGRGARRGDPQLDTRVMD